MRRTEPLSVRVGVPELSPDLGAGLVASIAQPWRTRSKK
jgi:hypothetical protein